MLPLVTGQCARLLTRPLVTMLMAVAMLGEKVEPIALGRRSVRLCRRADHAGAGYICLESRAVGSAPLDHLRGAGGDPDSDAALRKHDCDDGLLYGRPDRHHLHSGAFRRGNRYAARTGPPCSESACWRRSGNSALLRAYRIASASLLAPFGYLSIVFATASGYVFFGEVPDLRTLIGIIVIIATLAGSRLPGTSAKR